MALPYESQDFVVRHSGRPGQAAQQFFFPPGEATQDQFPENHRVEQHEAVVVEQQGQGARLLLPGEEAAPD